MSDAFPWGDPNPPGGFKVGDHVALAYSDHEEYIFDNPTGVVTEVEEHDGEQQSVTVQVEASISIDRVVLVKREAMSS